MLVRSLFAALLVIGSAVASAKDFKIGHMGIPQHDTVIRHLTDNQAIIIPKPGAKGLIAFQALENKEVDFLLVTTAALYITPNKEPNLFGFDPIKQFKLVGVLAETPSAFYMSPKYSSISELKNKVGPIMHAATGDESTELIDSFFKDKEIVHVTYRGVGQQLIDVKAGIADISVDSEPKVVAFGGTPTPTNHKYKIYLITRHDVSKEEIKELKVLINGNINSAKAKDFSTATKTKFIPLKGN